MGRRTGEVAEKGGKCGGETQRKKGNGVNSFNCLRITLCRQYWDFLGGKTQQQYTVLNLETQKSVSTQQEGFNRLGWIMNSCNLCR